MVTLEGAAQVFVRSILKKIVISCLDSANGIQKSCFENKTKNDSFIAHFY